MSEDRIEDALRAWCDREEDVDLETFLREYPDLADELRPRLEVLSVLDQALAESVPLPEALPETIGGFRILRELGRGGMGVVYEAEQATMERRVALKLMAPAFTSSPRTVQRFLREAKAAGLLHHTNIVPVHTLDRHEGYLYYTMDFIEGGSLAEWIERRRETTSLRRNSGQAHSRRVAEMFAGVADALDAAHKAGIIHRDIKPANLLLDGGDTLKIVDFGMARLDDAPSLTLSGEILGTPVYMSPEQAQTRKGKIDHRTDIYSLGAALYETLALRTPFDGESTHEICSKIISSEPPPLRRVDPRIPRDLATIVGKAMEKDRDDRYSTARAMARDLARFVDGGPIQARPVGPLVRAWRLVKRHRVRSALMVAVVMLALVAGTFAVLATRNAAERREFEYRELLLLGGEASASAVLGLPDSERALEPSHGDTTRHDFAASLQLLPDRPEALRGGKARDYFGRAIRLLPDRPDAYWLRALLPGATIDQRLADLKAARERGLPATTAQILRDYLLATLKQSEVARAFAKAEAYEPTSATECYAKARILIAGGRKRPAIRLLDRAIRQSAVTSSIHYLSLSQRADLRRLLGDPTGALEDLLVIRRQIDSSPRMGARIAVLWKQVGNEERGEAEFADVVARVRTLGTVAAWHSLCLVCCVSDAFDWLDRASGQALQQFPDAPDMLFWRGVLTAQNGQPQTALTWVGRVLEKDPDHHMAHRLRARVLRGEGDHEGALAAWDRAVQADDTCASCYKGRGLLLVADLKEYERALADFERALDFRPGWAQATLFKGSTLRLLGRFGEALVTFSRAIELRPDAALPYHRRGTLLLDHFEDAEKACGDFRKAVELDPIWPGDYANLAKALNRLRKHEEALEAARKCRELDPSNCLANREMGRSFRDLGEYPDAVAAYRRAISADPSDLHAHSNLGVLLSNKLNDQKAALVHFDKIVKELDVEDSQTWENRAVVLRRLGRYDEALESVDAARECGLSEARAERLRSDVYSRAGNHEAALDAIDRAIALDPATASLHGKRGVKLADLEKWAPAETAFALAVDMDPGDAKNWANLGMVRRCLENYEGSRKAYERAIDLGLADYRGYALTLFAGGHREDALAAIEKAIDRNPQDAFLHERKAGFCFALDMIDEGIEALRSVVMLHPPEESMVLRNLADILVQQDRHDEALNALDEAIRINPSFWQALHMRGCMFGDREDFEAAAADFARACELNPTDPLHWIGHGDSLNRLGQHEEALRVADEAIALAPNSADAYQVRGIAAGVRRDFEAARQALSRAVELAPAAAKNRVNLALVLTELGEFEEALEQIDVAVSLEPENPKWKEMRAKIVARLP